MLMSIPCSSLSCCRWSSAISISIVSHSFILRSRRSAITAAGGKEGSCCDAGGEGCCCGAGGGGKETTFKGDE